MGLIEEYFLSILTDFNQI